MAVPPAVRRLVTGLTVLVIVTTALLNVPRPYYDFQSVPLLSRVQQHQTYGPDTIADMYEARVVLNDPRDMYTKRLVEQTPLEAQTWSKAASAPYPPVTLLFESALYVIGERTGLGFYGMVSVLAALFLLASLWYTQQTRWYLFPLLYLNFSYFGMQFFYMQQGSYLLMLTAIMGALLLARGGRPAVAHPLMALGTALKLSPVYYLRHLPSMSRGSAALCLAIVIGGLALPVLIWEDYLYIYGFHNLKGGESETISALLVTVPFTVVIWYVETRLGFSWEDRIGWGLVPGALFLGLKMNSARHLILPLLIPDRRGVRNVAAAIGLALPAIFPGIVRQNSGLLIAAGVLAIGLAYYLREIGWDVVRDDLRHPLRTLRMMLTPPSAPATSTPNPEQPQSQSSPWAEPDGSRLRRPDRAARADVDRVTPAP